MEGIVVKRVREVSVESVADPGLEAPTDALIGVTSSAICGTTHVCCGFCARCVKVVLQTGSG
jgi:threonine dehydrogenase-like Zn-dependent dehydrogenase